MLYIFYLIFFFLKHMVFFLECWNVKRDSWILSQVRISHFLTYSHSLTVKSKVKKLWKCTFFPTLIWKQKLTQFHMRLSVARIYSTQDEWVPQTLLGIDVIFGLCILFLKYKDFWVWKHNWAKGFSEGFMGFCFKMSKGGHSVLVLGRWRGWVSNLWQTIRWCGNMVHLMPIKSMKTSFHILSI
jgi:hypothetical protein